MSHPTSRGSTACPRVRLFAIVVCAWLVVLASSANASLLAPSTSSARIGGAVYATEGDPNTPDEVGGTTSGVKRSSISTIDDGSLGPVDWFGAWSWFLF